MDILIDKINKLNCPIVVGLDSNIDYIPSFIKKEAATKFKNEKEATANAILNFNKYMIDAIFEIVPAIKLQLAYYELFGHYGIWALEETIDYAKNKGMYIIADGKRNDIGPTMAAYSSAYLGKIRLINNRQEWGLSCDSITVNGYFGSDCLKIVFDDCIKFNRTMFVLFKTSNPSSFEIQDEKLQNGKTLFEHIGKLCENLGKNAIGKYGFSKIGAVVGATCKKELKSLRETFKNIFFLVPGYGAQGANANDISAAFNKNKTGAIINSSRAILTAWQKENYNEKDFTIAAIKALKKMKNDIISSIG